MELTKCFGPLFVFFEAIGNHGKTRCVSERWAHALQTTGHKQKRKRIRIREYKRGRELNAQATDHWQIIADMIY